MAPLFASRREQNPLLAHLSLHFVAFGVPRIELGPHAPHACILPLYYTPTGKILGPIRVYLPISEPNPRSSTTPGYHYTILRDGQYNMKHKTRNASKIHLCRIFDLSF